MEMSAQITNNVYVINEVLLAQQSIKDLLSSLLPSHASNLPPVAQGTYGSVALLSSMSLRRGGQISANPSGVPVAGAVLVPSPRDHHSELPSPHSWMTADTVPATTINDAQNLQPTECTTASADVSQTEVVAKDAHTPSTTNPRSPCTESAQTGTLTLSPLCDSRVSTRSRLATGDPITDIGIAGGAERTKCAPKEKSEAIACTRACWILHPDAGDDIVAEGRAGCRNTETQPTSG